MRAWSPRRAFSLSLLILAACTTENAPPCLEGSDECAGVCVTLASDNEHCGACGVRCEGTTSCRDGACVDVTPVQLLCEAPSIICDGGCVDPRTDNANCGTCGRACAPGQVCSGGVCAATCGPQFVTCGAGDTASCASLSDDPSNCGECGTLCPVRANAASVCSSGDCAYVCAAGYADCNLDPADGCEVELDSNALHCGQCGAVCPYNSMLNQVGTCTELVCGVGCPAGYDDCEADSELACYTHIAEDLWNCGACGNVCPTDGQKPNQQTTCTEGVCGYACQSWADDCDGDVDNGCEQDIASSLEHCGGCGNACPEPGPNETAACNGGTCGTSCMGGYLNCSDQAAGCEVNGQTDVSHCGECGNACVQGANSTSVGCVTGACTQSCTNGFDDCDGIDDNGCERDLQNDELNCGACGEVCGQGQSCVTGECVTPPAGTLDQSYAQTGTGFPNSGYLSSAWQSYTAGRTGELGQVAFYGSFGDAANYSVDVRLGQGDSGTLLGSLPATSGAGWVLVHVPTDLHIEQTSGTQYTLVFHRVSGALHTNSANEYSGGCMGDLGGGCRGTYDASFQTWVR